MKTSPRIHSGPTRAGRSMPMKPLTHCSCPPALTFSTYCSAVSSHSTPPIVSLTLGMDGICAQSTEACPLGAAAHTPPMDSSSMLRSAVSESSWNSVPLLLSLYMPAALWHMSQAADFFTRFKSDSSCSPSIPMRSSPSRRCFCASTILASSIADSFLLPFPKLATWPSSSSASHIPREVQTCSGENSERYCAIRGMYSFTSESHWLRTVGVAPMALFRASTSAVGPAMREVPVSAMPVQPPLQMLRLLPSTSMPSMSCCQ
mmetsp:Transcript_37904/g.67953  ORF Transcript_37904/g.67953 Transcript_37904/m.67953 type:complete len:261 (+) Transcript_37904:79-861(+)